MIAPSEINTIADVIIWMEETMLVTPFGKVGVEVVMHEGKPQFIIPKWEPNIRLLNSKKAEKVEEKT